MYEVETKVFNQAVKRNIDRFPCDFMFQLSKDEFKNWRSQFVTSNNDKIGLRRPPYAFTEQGVSMLSAILKSKKAVDISIQIIRTFTKLREFSLNYQGISKKLNEIETTMKVDQQQTNYTTHKIDEAFELLNQILKDTKDIDKNLIGFRPIKKED